MLIRAVSGLSVAVLIAAGGAHANEAEAVSWKVDRVSGEEVLHSVRDVVVNLGRDGVVNGNGGCNSFMGRYVTNGDAILMSPLATTMMICEGSASDQEVLVLRALQEARTFTETDTQLDLRDAEGDVVLSLTRMDDTN